MINGTVDVANASREMTKEEIAAVLQLTSVLGIHTMSLSAPILLEEIAAREAAAPATV